MPPRRTVRLALAALAALGTACAAAGRVHPRAAEEVARGYAHLEAGDRERPEVAFRHALAFAPDLPEALNGLGVVERRRGRIGAAQRRYAQALEASPDFAEAQVNTGEALAAGGWGEAADERFAAALAVDPDLAVARLDRARALLHRGLAAAGAERAALWARARREYLHLLESQPGRPEAFHDLAFMDYLSGDAARAERAYLRAAELRPGWPEALHGLCISRVRLGRCAEGAEACRRCLAAAPGNAQCSQSLRGALGCAR